MHLLPAVAPVLCWVDTLSSSPLIPTRHLAAG